MENKIRINLGENLELVAELYNHDGNHPEITVYIEKDGVIHQDICLVRPFEQFHSKTMEFETRKDFVECLVWGDSDDEDYTDRHVIGIYEEEE